MDVFYWRVISAVTLLIFVMRLLRNNNQRKVIARNSSVAIGGNNSGNIKIVTSGNRGEFSGLFDVWSIVTGLASLISLYIGMRW